MVSGSEPAYHESRSVNATPWYRPSRSGSSGLRSPTRSTTLSIAAASSAGIRSSASETSSSNRCGLIRTATRLLPRQRQWRRHRVAGRRAQCGRPGVGRDGCHGSGRRIGRRRDTGVLRRRRHLIRRRGRTVEERIARRWSRGGRRLVRRGLLGLLGLLAARRLLRQVLGLLALVGLAAALAALAAR